MPRLRPLLVATGAVAAVTVVLGGVLCRFVFDCHLHAGRMHPKARPATGFADDVVVKGLAAATSFAFLPDGRILFGEKSGILRVASAGRLLRSHSSTSDPRSRTNNSGDSSA